ncbi:MAG: hypothetical protein LBO05_06035 [Deltaproteobacteria bacterium]|nr:hypothetical protein [Deltaproteobacteria bacterium]
MLGIILGAVLLIAAFVLFRPRNPIIGNWEVEGMKATVTPTSSSLETNFDGRQKIERVHYIKESGNWFLCAEETGNCDSVEIVSKNKIRIPGITLIRR